MLVDGGADTPEGWAALDAGVRGAVGGCERVRYNVVTHMHVDHIGLAGRVRAASGADLVMHRLDAERIVSAFADPEGEATYRAGVLRRGGAPAELWRWAEIREAPEPPPAELHLEGEDGPLPGAPGWRWLWTPGHTAGHISLLREEDGVLIAGDAVLPRITPTIGVNRQRDDPVGDYRDALARIERADVQHILPGHGEPIPSPTVRLRELGDALDAESHALEATLSDRPRSAWEIASERYTGRDLPASAWIQALRETLAHLEHLVAAGRARGQEREDGWTGFVRA